MNFGFPPYIPQNLTTLWGFFPEIYPEFPKMVSGSDGKSFTYLVS